MVERPRTARQILANTYLIILHVAVLYLVGDRIMAKYVNGPETEPTAHANSETEPGRPSAPEPTSGPKPVATNAVPMQTNPISFPGELIIPVAGVKPEQLIDSFSDARSNERVHDAIDIAAPPGTPVIAAAGGEIVRFFDSELGGITIYQLSDDRRFVMYYAHLQRRADDVKVGDVVRQGQTIGFVGDTGNAGAGNYHLHFSIAAIADPKRYFEGVYINPFPILRNKGKLRPN